MGLGHMTVAERYRAVAAGFTTVVEGVQDWDAPTPVKEWRVRDVVEHLVSWLPGLLEPGSSVRFEAGPWSEDDPVGAWRVLDLQVQALLDDPETASLRHSGQPIGERPVPEVVDQYFTTDVFLHTWDLAKGSGQEPNLEPEQVGVLYAGMTSARDLIRGSGRFGEEQPVPPDATDLERLMAFLGRDPRWQRP